MERRRWRTDGRRKGAGGCRQTSASSRRRRVPTARYDHIHGLGLGLNKNAKNKDGAVKFLKWLSTEEAALVYAEAGGSPALAPDVVAKIADERPDLVKLGEYAGAYGYVMNGATSANALSIYEAAGQGVHRLLVRPGDARRGAGEYQSRHGPNC